MNKEIQNCMVCYSALPKRIIAYPCLCKFEVCEDCLKILTKCLYCRKPFTTEKYTHIISTVFGVNIYTIIMCIYDRLTGTLFKVLIVYFLLV